MRWKTLSKPEARRITKQWNAMSREAFLEKKKTWNDEIQRELSPDYRALRNEITQAWNDACMAVQEGNYRKREILYATDLHFAVSLYRIMCQWHISPKEASNDHLWIYLSVKVFPDLISMRFTEKTDQETEGTVNVNEARYWKNSSRIYLRCLWWYIHLSLQRCRTLELSLEKTYEKLQFNSVEIIYLLVEKGGRSWCNVEVYREIMSCFAGLQFRCENRAELFRKVISLHAARALTVQPCLYKGGIREYVSDIFDYFGY